MLYVSIITTISRLQWNTISGIVLLSRDDVWPVLNCVLIFHGADFSKGYIAVNVFVSTSILRVNENDGGAE